MTPSKKIQWKNPNEMLRRAGGALSGLGGLPKPEDKKKKEDEKKDDRKNKRPWERFSEAMKGLGSKK